MNFRLSAADSSVETALHGTAATTRESKSPVRFLIIGGCWTHNASQAIERISLESGIRTKVEVAWPAQLRDGTLGVFDVVVLQPTIHWFLRPLWDNGPFLTDAEREENLQILLNSLALSLRRAKSCAKNGLLLVQGFSTPTHSPLGTTEFRVKFNFQRIVASLNEAIFAFIQNDPDAMYIDEERILSAVGKQHVLDDTVSTYSHHGPLGTLHNHAYSSETMSDSMGRDRVAALFARSYLDAFITWSGVGRIKCIVLDLDNTLWPGEAGDDQFSLAAQSVQFEFGVFGGIHQALKILKHRGILLATCSRNAMPDAVRAFESLKSLSRAHGLAHLLWWDDFVLHRVNWDSKVNNIRDIASTLHLAPEAILFIDDSTIEREAVKSSFPSMWVLGEDVYSVRKALISDPRLQANIVTAEAAARTEAVRAQLARDVARKDASDESEFLRSLKIYVTITKTDRREDAVRLVELTQRTTQFNTTLMRFSTAEMERLLASDTGAVYTLQVSDRFASYGTVGACILLNDDIIAFVVSCRVIPLQVEMPFLCGVLRHHDRFPAYATVNEGPRNLPCRTIYQRAGFEAIGDGRYALFDVSKLHRCEPDVYSVCIEA